MGRHSSLTFALFLDLAWQADVKLPSYSRTTQQAASSLSGSGSPDCSIARPRLKKPGKDGCSVTRGISAILVEFGLLCPIRGRTSNDCASSLLRNLKLQARAA